jgi:hypothetical protein
MKPVLLLRIAAVLVFVNALGHTIGGVFGGAPPGAGAVVAAMRDVHFVAGGVTRTYWDYFFGYGLSLTVFLLLEAVVFWQLAAIVKTDATAAVRLRPVVMSFCVACVVAAALCWKYFFAGPAIFQFLIAGCLLGAWAGIGLGERTA